MIWGRFNVATKVVNLRKDKYDVYIGRGSKWGNPYYMQFPEQRDEVCDKYEEWFWKTDLITVVQGGARERRCSNEDNRRYRQGLYY
jgi:hypothetical protein